MGHIKDIIIETAEELRFVASRGDPEDIAAITAYLKGERGSTHGVISPTFEANLDLDIGGFQVAWDEILQEAKGEGEESSEEWVPVSP
jgi:hypothetical protein